jgi:hypothetical protein
MLNPKGWQGFFLEIHESKKIFGRKGKSLEKMVLTA